MDSFRRVPGLAVRADADGEFPVIGKTQSVNVAEAKKRLSDLLGRVAYGGESVRSTPRRRVSRSGSRTP